MEKEYYGQYDRFILATLCGLAILIAVLVRNHFFFWDTVQLASKQAHFFFENNFQSFLLPNEIDSGHPPFFGAYIASVWKVFGKSLPASHFALLPFTLGNIVLFYKIGKHYLGNWGIAFPIICFVDPTLSAQSILVSPDTVVVFFFLLGWYALLSEKEKMLAIAVTGLAAISMRGIMVGFALFLFSLFRKRKAKTFSSDFFQKITPFLPGGVFGLAFLIFHYAETGWIGYHPGSPWAKSFQSVNFQGFVKNIGVLFWRYFDFGRIFIYGTVIFAYLQIDFKKKPKFKELAVFTAILELVLIPSLLLHKGLPGHRYLLPIFLSINLLFCAVIFEELILKKKKLWLIAGCFFLLTGSLWIYPKKISQGWDASLAHLPFYDLRNELVDYLKKEGISPEEVGTAFPQIGDFEIYDLNGGHSGFVPKNFKKNKYIFYSSVMNDFSNEEIDLLENFWEEKFKLKKFGIEVILYMKP